MGQALPGDRPGLAAGLGIRRAVVRVSTGDPQAKEHLNKQMRL
jgi:hypothetical protein